MSGVINAALPADQLAEHTRCIARQIVSASPQIVGIGKRAFYAQIEMDQHAAYEHTGKYAEYARIEYSGPS